eukprot:1373454-Rhodomonas_salina.1
MRFSHIPKRIWLCLTARYACASQRGVQDVNGVTVTCAIYDSMEDMSKGAKLVPFYPSLTLIATQKQKRWLPHRNTIHITSQTARLATGLHLQLSMSLSLCGVAHQVVDDFEHGELK